MVKITGRQALHTIDGAITAQRSGLTQLTDIVRELEHDLFEVRRQEANHFENMTKLRLTSLGEREEGVDELGRIDKQASRLIDTHESHLEDLAMSVDETVAKVETLEGQRREHEEALSDAISAHEAAAEKTRLSLESDVNYLGLAEALEKANGIVDHAASKQKVVIRDRVAKGKPYEADPLFMYLWRRKFATNDYKSGPLTSMLDGWVAKLIKYRKSRLNYERLLELPERLSEHVTYVEEKANELASKVEAYERDALTKDGVTALRDEVERVRDAIDTFDAQIADAEEVRAQAQTSFEVASQGLQGPLKEAQDLLMKAVETKTIPDLKILAAETLSPLDDQYVEELAELRLERLSLEDEVKANKKLAKKRQKSLSRLERMRQQFKKSRFDSHQSTFKNGDLIALLMNEYSQGTIDIDDVWRKIEKNHRLNRRDWEDDFGGDQWRGGFGLPGYGSRQSGGLGRMGRDIGRQIERELGRELGRGLEVIINSGGISGRSVGRGGRYRPTRTRRRGPRTRPGTIRVPRSTRKRSIRLPRGGGFGGRSGGGGFKTGGGF